MFFSSFFASQACPTKTASPFVGGAVQTGIACPNICFLRVVNDFTSSFDKSDLFAVYVYSINNISWSKRKVGPMVYVTELGTLESATAPLADCPHAVCSVGLDTMMNKNNIHPVYCINQWINWRLPQAAQDGKEQSVVSVA